MRSVTVSRRVYEGPGKYRNEVFDAVFHAWGGLYDEFEAGPGNYSVAIVERHNGQVETVLPSEIQFAESMVEKLKKQVAYQTDRADANWKALCECRGEDE